MLLRWTAAFKEKAEKFSVYRKRGKVGSTDAFVIAIDGSQLSKFPDTHGISQRPFITEVVFPIGPLAKPVDLQTGRFGPMYQTVQVSVENRNNAPVHKDRFFRPEYAGISAVLGSCPIVRSNPELPVQIAYNPLAEVRMEPGNLGSTAEEWVAECAGTVADGQEWVLKRI